MTDHLTVHLSRAAGALVRLLGLAERRGYPAHCVTAAPVDSVTQVVHLTICSERPTQALIHQLHKLYDVHHVARKP